MSDLREAAAILFHKLDELGIEYAVGGSLAGSIHGVARATQDVDLVVRLSVEQVTSLHRAISRDFYADDVAILDAIRRGVSFNLIHLESGFKFDLFVAARHPLGSEQLAHKRKIATAVLGGEPMEFQVISAEDIILVKLHWYRQGNEISERQWNDLKNLMAVQAARVDRSYLDSQASRLGVDDLLKRLLTET